MDGSSYIGQLIAGADSDRSKEIEDTCGFTGDTNYHGTFLIASGQTVTVGTAYETPETVYNTDGTRKYFGQITGVDSTSTLIVKEDGSDEAYLKAGSYVWNTVTSSWESAFIVTFNPNYEGGECTFQKIDGTANLTQNTFVRQGYTFLGWNTAADGSGDDYADGEEITATSGEPGITLYAQWKDPIARIDDTMYATISDAVDAAQGDVTIVLLGSTKESVTIPANKGIILDLGTWTISNEDGKHTITVAPTHGFCNSAFISCCSCSFKSNIVFLRIFLRRSLIDMVLLQLHLAHFLTQIELRAVHNLLDRFVGRTALLHHHDLRERQHGHRHRCAVMEQSQRLEQILRGPQRALEHHVREFVYGRSLSSENRTIQTGQIDGGVQQMVQAPR